jgi:molecular chaperone DnaK
MFFFSRIPGGDVDGGPLQVVLTQGKLEELTMELWRRCRLPLDQARC